MTARTMAAELRDGKPTRDITQKNIDKVTRYRPNGREELEALAFEFEREVDPDEEELEVKVPQKKKVYPEPRHTREPPKKARWTRN
jgi:large subunit ribosomal protein L17